MLEACPPETPIPMDRCVEPDVILFLLLFASLWLASRTLLDRTSLRRQEKALGAWLLTLQSIVASAFVCGMLGAFRLFPLAICMLACATFVAFFAWRQGAPGKPLIACICGTPRRLWNHVRQSPLFLSLILLNLAGLALIATTALVHPPRSWDGLSYHLPFASHLLATDTLSVYPSSLAIVNSYPNHGELLMAVLMEFTGSDRAACLAQVLFLPIAWLAIVLGARRCGAHRTQARNAALLLLCVPIVFHQLSTAYVDVMLAASLLACAVLVTPRFDRARHLLHVIALATALGIKATAWSAVPLCAPLLFWRFVKRKPNPTRSRPSRLLLTGALLVPLGLSLHWYVRNWIVYENPFHDRRVAVLGVEFFPGEKPIQRTSLQHAWKHSNSPALAMLDTPGPITYDGRLGGFGPLTLGFFVPALLLALWRQRKRRLDAVTLLVLLTLVMPYGKNPRFVMILPAAGSMALAAWMSRQGKLERRLCESLVLAGCAVTALLQWPDPDRLRARTLHNALRGNLPRELLLQEEFPYEGEHGHGELSALIQSHVEPGSRVVLATANWMFEHPLFDDAHTLRLEALIAAASNHVRGAAPIDKTVPDYLIAPHHPRLAAAAQASLAQRSSTFVHLLHRWIQSMEEVAQAGGYRVLKRRTP